MSCYVFVYLWVPTLIKVSEEQIAGEVKYFYLFKRNKEVNPPEPDRRRLFPVKEEAEANFVTFSIINRTLLK